MGLNQVSSLGKNVQALNGLGLKSCPECQVRGKEYIYLCISVRITWFGSLRLSGNLSAIFLSPFLIKASHSFSAVASFPSRSSQRIRTSIQHSLAQLLFPFSVQLIKAWLNPNSRAKSFHFSPMSSDNSFSWKSASVKVYFRSQPSWLEDATKDQATFKLLTRSLRSHVRVSVVSKETAWRIELNYFLCPVTCRYKFN